MRQAVFAALAFLPAVASAQVTIQGSNETISLSEPTIERETQVKVNSAPEAVLRGLDRLAGESIDLVAGADTTLEFGTLQIEMKDCRYPSGNPNSDAYVLLTIRDRNVTEPVFNGWMVASSPALNALDHPRYDIWAIRCKLDDRTPAVVAGESSPRPLMRPAVLSGN